LNYAFGGLFGDFGEVGSVKIKHVLLRNNTCKPGAHDKSEKNCQIIDVAIPEDGRV